MAKCLDTVHRWELVMTNDVVVFVERYLADRQRLGFELRSSGYYLCSFAKHVQSSNHLVRRRDPVSQSTAVSTRRSTNFTSFETKTDEWGSCLAPRRRKAIMSANDSAPTSPVALTGAGFHTDCD
jgi:hypothetical protein